MPERVYIETSIISFLTARPSRDLIVAAHQHLTREWWQTRRGDFDLFTSRFALESAGDENEQTARRCLEALGPMRFLEPNAGALALARDFVDQRVLPPSAADDALQIAVATVHGMHYLLTWDGRHIANAAIWRDLATICQTRGHELPIICTPAQLMGDRPTWRDPIVEEVRGVRAVGGGE